ncbi:MAG TPA: alpha-L-fucosidase, partial [Candidatus Coprenecus stercoravium]|nr:alpha-L-fucosidase [Candidatus Coprenecus stercoravium]
MKKHLLSIAALSFMIVAPAFSASAQEDYRPSPEIVQSQEQFRENRFGIFIHWGIYSMYGQGE